MTNTDASIGNPEIVFGNTRHNQLKTVAFLLATFILPSCGVVSLSSPRSGDKPNILVVLVDEIR